MENKIAARSRRFGGRVVGSEAEVVRPKTGGVGSRCACRPTRNVKQMRLRTCDVCHHQIEEEGMSALRRLRDVIAVRTRRAHNGGPFHTMDVLCCLTMTFTVFFLCISTERGYFLPLMHHHRAYIMMTMMIMMERPSLKRISSRQSRTDGTIVVIKLHKSPQKLGT